jgi:hypothetical protein
MKIIIFYYSYQHINYKKNILKKINLNYFHIKSILKIRIYDNNKLILQARSQPRINHSTNHHSLIMIQLSAEFRC